METYARKRINTGVTATPVTTNFVSTSCAIQQVFVAVDDPGSTWTLKIQDKASPPFVILPALTLTKTTLDWQIQNFEGPLFMEGGIDAITTGGTAGAVAIWIHFIDGR